MRIVPATGCYVIEVFYTVKPQNVDNECNKHIAAIDLGVNNLATVTTNKPGFQPILINGRPIKSINNRYNKFISKLRSINKKLHGLDWSNRMELMTRRRNHKIDSYLHRASKLLISTLEGLGIGTLVIGLNPQWKLNCNMGKRTNQKFVSLPHIKFVDMLTYKGNIAGIKVCIREESYTSLSRLQRLQRIYSNIFTSLTLSTTLFSKSFIIPAILQDRLGLLTIYPPSASKLLNLQNFKYLNPLFSSLQPRISGYTVVQAR